jgi:hypothetical protein
MMRNFGTCLFVMLVACVAVAHAQQPVAPANATRQITTKAQVNSDPLEVKLARSKVVVLDGRETMQTATVAKPGEILFEVATYTNKSGSTLKNLEATLPVPANTELQLASVKPGNAKASTDGSQFSTLPLKRRVRQANGIEVEQPVPVSEYRYLRWYPGDLAADKSLVFSARFKVSNDSPAAVLPAGK